MVGHLGLHVKTVNRARHFTTFVYLHFGLLETKVHQFLPPASVYKHQTVFIPSKSVYIIPFLKRVIELTNIRAMFKFVALLLCCWASLSAGRLTTSGTNFYYNNQKVFLSGVNIAWNSYGYDFGNGQYVANSKSTLESWLTQIDANGGNSVRKFTD